MCLACIEGGLFGGVVVVGMAGGVITLATLITTFSVKVRGSRTYAHTMCVNPRGVIIAKQAVS